jgi:L-galactose dehydrogenase/L-glyceraldehyde 3-phosphate reductase
VATAISLGINYFDTAPSYGDGVSETNLGRALKELKADVFVGTKVSLAAQERRDISTGIIALVDRSLTRLGVDSVDLIQLHNRVGINPDPAGSDLNVAEVLADVVKTFQDLKSQGKVRFFGMTGLGDTEALHKIIDAGALDTVQVCYNLLNPSAGATMPDHISDDMPDQWYVQDFGKLIDRAAARNAGVIGIRVLAAGALSGVIQRHPVVVPWVAPIGSGRNYEEDVRQAGRFHFLVTEGTVQSMVEAALRFALSKEGISTALVGFSSLEHLEQSAEWASRGVLSASALDRISTAWPSFKSVNPVTFPDNVGACNLPSSMDQASRRTRTQP